VPLRVSCAQSDPLLARLLQQVATLRMTHAVRARRGMDEQQQRVSPLVDVGMRSTGVASCLLAESEGNSAAGYPGKCKGRYSLKARVRSLHSESTFAAVKLRTRKTKGAGRRTYGRQCSCALKGSGRINSNGLQAFGGRPSALAQRQLTPP
jgi:hypothetical protein